MAKVENKAIFTLFFASGISGLVYEVIWFRILSRVIGVTTYATATTLAAFMAGLALGSYALGKLVDKRKDLLKIFALLQLLVAAVAITVPVFLKIVPDISRYIYQISNQNNTVAAIARASVAFITLLLPATIMGGTLPVLVSYLVKKKRVFGRNLSLLYGLNTLGATLGVVLTGFITIGIIGEWNSLLIGVLINCIVGIKAFSLYKKEAGDTEDNKITENNPCVSDTLISPYPERVQKAILISMLISGFTALSYEVIWTRQLILFLGPSIYAFSAMLAVFLMGVSLGSIYMAKFIDKLKMPLVVFGFLELLIGMLSILNLYVFPLLDYPYLNKLSPIILVFPITFIFGMIFTIASLCYTKSISKVGFSVGTLYSYNTIGNIGGSILTGFVFIGLLGSGRTIILLSVLNIILGLFLLWVEAGRKISFRLRYLSIIPAAIFLSFGFTSKDPVLEVIAKRISKRGSDYKIFYNRESTEGTVTSYMANNIKELWINGVGMTYLLTETKLIAHLPIMLAKDPKKFLVICFGMGTTVRSAALYDNLNITSVELVPKVYECFKYYHSDAEKILAKKNINFLTGDGRNFLILSPEKYDVITVDPSPPIYSAGAVNLYSKDFFILCKQHLTPNGIMCLFFPWRGDTSKDIFKTFYSVFPHTTIWSTIYPWGFFVIGSPSPINIDKAKIEQAFKDQKIIDDLSEYNKDCVSSSQLLKLLSWKEEDIKNITSGALVITDNFPYTEFPLQYNLLHKIQRALYQR